jgi:hypothetical protein
VITVRYTSLDRVNDRRTFKSLAGAQRFAQERVGATPEISAPRDGGRYRGYAVSADGVGKIVIEAGARYLDLFPALSRGTAEAHEAEFHAAMAAEAAAERAETEANAAAYMAAAKAFDAPRAPGCRCSEQQLVQVGCDCGAEDAPAPAAKAAQPMTARKAGRGYDVFALSAADLKRFPDARKLGHLTLDGRFGSDDEELVDWVKAASIQLGVTRQSPLADMLAAVRQGFERMHENLRRESEAELAAENAWLRAAEAPTNDDLGFEEYEARRLGLL